MADALDLDPLRRLAFAVLVRARKDLQAARPGFDRRASRTAKAATLDAHAWVTDGGEWFEWWCHAAGVDPTRARRAMLNGDARPAPKRG